MHAMAVAKIQFTEITNLAVPGEATTLLMRASINPAIHVIAIADITRNTQRWPHWVPLTKLGTFALTTSMALTSSNAIPQLQQINRRCVRLKGQDLFGPRLPQYHVPSLLLKRISRASAASPIAESTKCIFLPHALRSSGYSQVNASTGRKLWSNFWPTGRHPVVANFSKKSDIPFVIQRIRSVCGIRAHKWAPREWTSFGAYEQKVLCNTFSPSQSPDAHLSTWYLRAYLPQDANRVSVHCGMRKILKIDIPILKCVRPW